MHGTGDSEPRTNRSLRSSKDVALALTGARSTLSSLEHFLHHGGREVEGRYLGAVEG